MALVFYFVIKHNNVIFNKYSGNGMTILLLQRSRKICMLFVNAYWLFKCTQFFTVSISLDFTRERTLLILRA